MFQRDSKFLLRASVLPIVLALSACGGGSSDATPVPAPEPAPAPAPAPTTATFSLGVSDGPIDSASEVVVFFDEVELTGNGEPIRIDVADDNGDPRQVDLLTVQGATAAEIVADIEIPAGTYGQVRLSVTDESFIVLDSGTFPLEVPSGELRLDGIEVQAGSLAAYTVEFDLRKSLVDPVGQQAVFLKPRGVRLVANENVGTLVGTVDEQLILDESCAIKPDINEGNAVYLYEGIDLDFARLGDDADAPEDDNELSPFTTAPVNFNEETQNYEFEVGFLLAGDYTLAFTCLAGFDEPETDESEEDGFMLQTSQNLMIEAQQTTEVLIESPDTP